MNELPRPRSAPMLAKTPYAVPVIASKRNAHFYLPAALLVCGIMASFAWASFLAWCVLRVFI
jgi:hypothetical protein